MPTPEPTSPPPQDPPATQAASPLGGTSSKQPARPDYLQQAEEMAIRRLLEHRRFKNAVAIGGGYGYLYSLVSQYADIITLDDEHRPQKALPKTRAGTWNYKDGSVDLIVMVRFLHQFEDPAAQLQEVARVLSSEGIAILEVANYARHSRYLRKFRQRRHKGAAAESPMGSTSPSAPDPKQVIRQLAHAGLKVERILSVASIQSPRLRKLMPGRMLLAVEGLLQPALGKRYHGPSVFLSVKKIPLDM